MVDNDAVQNYPLFLNTETLYAILKNPVSTYENNRIPIDKLSDSLKNLISKDLVHEYLKKLADNYDNECESGNNVNTWHKTKFRILLRVHERVQFADRLYDIENSTVPNQIDIPPLRTYLLLTCFDQLGLKKGWMTFDHFLDSRKNVPIIKEEYNKNNDLSEIERIKSIYCIYKESFSVKNSFFNFINDMLTSESKIFLMNSIRINITDIKDILEKKETTEQEILDYLFKIRNDYTHSSYFTGIFNKPMKSDPEWTYREEYFIKNWRYAVYTKMNFKEIVKDTIFRGISNIIIENKYSV